MRSSPQVTPPEMSTGLPFGQNFSPIPPRENFPGYFQTPSSNESVSTHFGNFSISFNGTSTTINSSFRSPSDIPSNDTNPAAAPHPVTDFNPGFQGFPIPGSGANGFRTGM